MQHLGALAIFIFVLSSFLLLRTRKVSGRLTLSLHAAQSDTAHRLYALSELVVVLLTAVFVVEWFTPHFSLGLFYPLTMLIGLTGLALAAAVPHREEPLATIHLASANTLAICLLIANTHLVFNGTLSSVGSVAAQLSSILMGAVLIMGMFSLKRSARFTLLLQLVFFGSYMTSLLIVTYLG